MTSKSLIFIKCLIFTFLKIYQWLDVCFQGKMNIRKGKSGKRKTNMVSLYTRKRFCLFKILTILQIHSFDNNSVGDDLANLLQPFGERRGIGSLFYVNYSQMYLRLRRTCTKAKIFSSSTRRADPLTRHHVIARQERSRPEVVQTTYLFTQLVYGTCCKQVSILVQHRIVPRF